VLFRNCTISNSSSKRGGAMAVQGNASVAVLDNSVQLNSASGFGGGLAFDDNSFGN
jgi:predicted outer membrane repeat protein